MLPFCSKLAPCLIGGEACGTARYWARTLAAAEDIARSLVLACFFAGATDFLSDQGGTFCAVIDLATSPAWSLRRRLGHADRQTPSIHRI